MGNLINNIAGKSNYKALQSNIQSPVTTANAEDAYRQSQDALAQQQALLNALQGQNGIANQSQVYNQLQGVVAGTGPNPALAQLANATGQNIANQAALAAGQRGAGQNVGLIARQVGQLGANAQQQAIGQAAALQAQQSLNALGQASGVAGQQVGQQQNATQYLNQAAQGQQGLLYNQINAQNQGRLGIEQINSGNAQFNAGQMGKLTGSLINAAGGAAGAAGGKPPTPKAAAEGGAVEDLPVAAPEAPPMSLADYFGGQAMAAGGMPVTAPMLAAKGSTVPGQAKVAGDSYANDTVPAILSPGEIVIPRSVVGSKDAPKKAAEFVAAILAKKKMRK